MKHPNLEVSAEPQLPPDPFLEEEMKPLSESEEPKLAGAETAEMPVGHRP